MTPNEALRINEINDLKSQIRRLSSKIDDFNRRIDSQIRRLSSKIDDFNRRIDYIDYLEQRINALEQRLVLIEIDINSTKEDS